MKRIILILLLVQGLLILCSGAYWYHEGLNLAKIQRMRSTLLLIRGTNASSSKEDKQVSAEEWALANYYMRHSREDAEAVVFRELAVPNIIAGICVLFSSIALCVYESKKCRTIKGVLLRSASGASKYTHG